MSRRAQDLVCSFFSEIEVLSGGGPQCICWVENLNQITWNQFIDCFYINFFSANLRREKCQEFLEIKQGQMTVEEYD